MIRTSKYLASRFASICIIVLDSLCLALQSSLPSDISKRTSNELLTWRNSLLCYQHSTINRSSMFLLFWKSVKSSQWVLVQSIWRKWRLDISKFSLWKVAHSYCWWLQVCLELGYTSLYPLLQLEWLLG